MKLIQLNPLAKAIENIVEQIPGELSVRQEFHLFEILSHLKDELREEFEAEPITQWRN